MELVSKKIEENKKFVLDSFQNSSDLIHYEFEAGDNTKILIFYIEGFIDRNLLDRDIVKPLIHNKENKDIKKIISISSLSESGEIDEVISKITDGNVAIFFNGKTIAYLANLKNWEKRSIEEPQAEAVVRGPKEGFVEDISSNRNLLRKKSSQII